MGKSKRVKPQLAKGMRDQLGSSLLARQEMISKIRRVFERFGFQPLETPAIELEDTLIGAKVGENAKHIFSWGHEEENVRLGLRFDLTVPLARFVASNPHMRRPFKRYQHGSVFRVDKPGPGRFREFLQFDIDVVGTNSVLADAEILVAMGEVLTELGLPNYTVRWNHRGILNAALRRSGIEEDQFTPVIRILDKEDKIGPDGVRAELARGRIDEESGAKIEGLGLEGPKIDTLIEFLALQTTENASSENQTDSAAVIRVVEDWLGDTAGAAECLKQIHEIQESFVQMGGKAEQIVFSPNLARGMDYYTGAIFEATLDDLPAYGSIMGGGRYDHLVSRFSGEQLPGVGASIGIDRLLAALEESAATPARSSLTDVLVTIMDKKLLPAYQTLVHELRESGLNAEIYLKPKTRLGDQLKYASDWGIPFAVIMGEDEVTAKEVTVKDLEAGKEASEAMADREQWVDERPGQFQIARSELVGKLKDLLMRDQTR